jgi:hypothetical protein
VTYRFAGFLCPSRIERPATLPPGAVWREIEAPFAGTGVRIPELVGKSPEVEVVQKLAEALGLGASRTWLYITYDCWGGQIDSVYGLGLAKGASFGPIEEDSRAGVKGTFTQLMAHLGLTPEQAMQFPPFERGFWGET